MRNRLADESSPYLRQHADNPVHWQPWDAQALALARAEDKPILLSIGYSACHWCHVMAHESFEDAATAAVMNALYVNIKVDREERPDLDRIYQLAHQALSQRGGGWPLTLLLAPDDRLPFFAGTYFPNTPRHGMPAFVDLLQRARAWYDSHRAEAAAQNATLRGFLDQQFNAEHGSEPPAPLRDAAESALLRRFDPHWGGFGGAPKFPHTADLELLLDSANAAARHAALHTLARMAEGGIHDQIGGGFARYSVDARWAIPHFEKMLYDNALLLPLYAKAAALSGHAHYREAADGIALWLEREMRAPDGGYYAALDADSEGAEGRFYVWDADAVQALLDADEFAVAAAHWGLDAPANFEDRHWNLRVARPLREVAEAQQHTLERAQDLLDAARAKLLQARAHRPHPGLDDKRLSAWNGMLASGYARAAAWLDRPEWAARARAIVAFIQQRAVVAGRLHASVQGGEARFAGYLDDHAWLLTAHLDLLAVDPDPLHLRHALALADALLHHFEDRRAGGFYFTAHDHEALPARPRSFVDEATPSGNGITAQALLRLAWLSAEPRYLDAAERALRAAHDTLATSPSACASLLLALDHWHHPPTQAVVRLPQGDTRAWGEAVAALLQQGIRCVQLPSIDGAADPLPTHPGHPDGIAYVCSGSQCLPPLRDPALLVAQCRDGVG